MKKMFFTVLFLLACTSFLEAQQRKITGKVTDEDGGPLSGVSVLIKGLKTGDVTNDEGIFNLNADAAGTLVFSSMGYLSKEVTLGKSTVYNVTMVVDPKALTPVVVIGYGSVNRKDVTGSVGSVNVSDLQKAPVKSFDEALAGRVAGVQVVSSEGKPGSPINIVIRGGNSVTQSNSPLFVIDGFPMEDPGGDEANPINALDPADIETIDVLKDASATAIYGARGANGVVVITTKRGKAGKTQVTYNTYYGIQESNKRLAVLDPYQFVKLQYDIDPVMTTNLYLTRTIEGVKDTLPFEYYKNIKGINWEDQVMRTAPIRSHHLSLSGGNNKTKIGASFSYFNQDGIIINSGFRRAQGRLTLDHEINPRFKVGMNVAYSNVKTHGTPTSTTGFSNELNLLFSVWAYRPVSFLGSHTNLLEVPNDPEIEPGSEFRYNPIITTQNELRENFHENLVTNAFAEYAISKSLKLRVSGGYTRGLSRIDVFNNSLSRTGNPSSNLMVNGSQSFGGSNTWLNENTLTYNKKFNANHVLNVVGGVTVQESNRNYFGAMAKLIPNESLGLSGIDEGFPLSVTSTSSGWSMASALGRVNYNIKSKYLFTASLRSDGSSRFATENKWSAFPSAAFAWRMGSENFMKNISFISDAKFRASWGLTGNNNVGDFAYFQLYSAQLSSGYSFGNKLNFGSIPSNLGNQNLRWETTEQIDLGMDLELFKQRIKLTADVYRKNTTDLLLNATLPGSTGYANQTKNIGNIRNEGVELGLNAIVAEARDFKWTSSFNIAFNRNKVLKLGENELSMLTGQYWDDGWRSIPGYIAKLNGPVAAFYGQVWDGVYTYDDFDKVGSTYILKANITANGEARSAIKPGDVKYRDLNGDRVVDTYDRTVIGNPLPKHAGGFTNNFAYKGVDLSVFFQWSYGNDIYNANRLMLETGYKYNTNQYASYANHWTPENPDSKTPAVKGATTRYYSTWMVEDGSYLRLKTISLGYNLPKHMLDKVKVAAARLYFSAQNLYTWTNYSGYDPEVSVRNSALTPGFDYSAYPRAKTATVGLNITF